MALDEWSPAGLFGAPARSSINGRQCEWCGRMTPEGEKTAPFAGRYIGACCFDTLESAVIEQLPHLLPWLAEKHRFAKSVGELVTGAVRVLERRGHRVMGPREMIFHVEMDAVLATIPYGRREAWLTETGMQVIELLKEDTERNVPCP